MDLEQALEGGARLGAVVVEAGAEEVAIDPDGRSKSARLRVHAETIMAKRIYLPAGASWRDDFEPEHGMNLAD